MKKFEYRSVNSSIYNKCLNNANDLLKKISKHLNKSIVSLTPFDIIGYFENKYNILFVFFESDFSTPIKYKDIVSSPKYRPLYQELVNKMSGVTIPDGDKFIIMLNQTMPKTRIIFTILHELSHLHFHNIKENNIIFASKFKGDYPKELAPFENEANIIASLLFCSTIKLESLLVRNYSFDQIVVLTQMSRKGLHSRLLNYLHHIMGLNDKEALKLLLNFKNGNYKAGIKIKYFVNKKNGKYLRNKAKILKLRNGLYLEETRCISFLQRLTIKELILELEYARHSKNHLLEQLVMNEYYRKH